MMMMMMTTSLLLIIYHSISLLLVISSPLDSLHSIDNGSSSSNSDHIYQQSATGIRGAIIITLAGDHKLAQYFEWTCRTITYSSQYYDMLVFHESNSKVVTLNCANNVKLIDIGKNGLSRLIVNKILENDMSTSADTKNTLIKLLELILLHMPRYLVEIKPVLGSIFKDYLTNYSHWSYSDPDIVWGNLVDWMDIQDLVDYEIITVAKNMDAARLFLRGQVL